MSSTPPTFTPGQQPPSVDPFAFDRPKGLNELFRSAWVLWTGHTGIFLITAALVVIPFEVIVTGLLGGGFNDPMGTAAPWAQVLSPLFISTIGTALVTATHSRAVVALAQGQSLTTGEAFSLGLQGFGVIALTGITYFAAVLGGLVLLLIPGVFLAIAGVFAAQIAPLHGTGPITSLKSSVQLVRAAGWWRTFGYLFVLGLVGTGGAFLIGIVIGIASLATGESNSFGAFAVPLVAIVQAGVMSWTALVTTLLYFSWRAEQGQPFAPTGLFKPTSGAPAPATEAPLPPHHEPAPDEPSSGPSLEK